MVGICLARLCSFNYDDEYLLRNEPYPIYQFVFFRSNHLFLSDYDGALEQLIRALPLIAAGGFWVPRSVLSCFVDSILTGQGRRLKTDTITNLSRREQEVLDSLLENLSNKEIASKLNIAERTVKFHVSNLLNKFGVRRRADLILLTFQRRLSQA